MVNMFAVSNFTRLLPFIVLTLQCCMKVSRAAAGSEKDVHYWFLPTQGAVKEANEMEVFHEYKPQCVQITSDMYPCNSLQYTSLRMPNLLGQSTIAEVKSFLDSFGDSKFLGCDQYAKHFLCSLVTPLCFDGKPQFKIPPCRSMCERVRDKCFYQMSDNGLGIPGEFNCSKFVNDNLCMDPTKGTSTTPMPDNIPTYPSRGSGGDRDNNNNNNNKQGTSSSSNKGHKGGSSSSSTAVSVGGGGGGGDRGESGGSGGSSSRPEDLQYAQTGFKSGSDVFNDSHVHSALCYSPVHTPSTIVLRARIKSIRPKRKGYFIKVQKKHLKVFYDRDSVLGTIEGGKDDGVPTFAGLPLDQYFFRTFPKIQSSSNEGEVPVKKDVVYFFISRVESGESKGEMEQFFRVQFMIQDSGLAELRSQLNTGLKNPPPC